jgi:hypothetical protein
MMDNAQVTTTTTTENHADAGALDARVAKVLGDLRGGAQVDALDGVTAETPEEAGETAAEGQPAGKVRGKDGKFLKADAPVIEAPAADPDAERKEKLARIHDLEKNAFAKASKLTERERAAETRERTLKEREERLTALERSFGDPESLLQLLEEKVGAEKVSQWLLQQADPAKRTELAAKKATSAVEEKLQKLQEELRAKEQKLESERRALEERHAFERATSQLVGRVKEVAEEAPLVARFFEKRPQAAANMADQVARSFQGQEFNFDDVIIRMQQALAADAEIFGAQQSAESGTHSNRATSQSATAKAKTTVSNRDAAERSSIVKPDDEAELSLEERTQRAIERRRLRSVR